MKHGSNLLLLSASPTRGRHSGFSNFFVSIISILLRHFNLSHVLSHRIHKPLFRTSPFPLSWQLHPQHPSLNIPIVFPPYMSKPPQSCFSCFLSKPSHLRCSSNLFIPDLVHSCHSKSSNQLIISLQIMMLVWINYLLFYLCIIHVHFIFINVNYMFYISTAIMLFDRWFNIMLTSFLTLYYIDVAML